MAITNEEELIDMCPEDPGLVFRRSRLGEKKMLVRHRGLVKIAQKVILDFLQFPNGEIMKARINDMGILELLISDAEMPLAEENAPTPEVMLTFVKYQDVQGHWVAIREPL